MNYFRAANRAFLVFWMGWIFFWVGFVHWEWANVLADQWAFPPRHLPTDFFNGSRYKIHEWVAEKKLNDSELARAVRQFYSRPQGCQPSANILPPPKGFIIDCEDPYSDLSDNDLAQQIRAKYNSEDRSYFDTHWNQFKKYKDWRFRDFYLASLKLSWLKSRPPGVEFLLGLASPALAYAMFALSGWWVWQGFRRP